MSKSRRRNSSDELDVFEATLYYSGEVHEANLNGIRRSVAERRSVDAPGEETTELFQRLAKSECQSKDKGGRQPCPGAKLASLIRSFFDQVIWKKKKKKAAASEYLEKQAKRSMANARAAPPGQALVAKEGEWRGRTEEEDGGGSDSSSDLFELENYAMGVCNSKSYLFMRPTWK